MPFAQFVRVARVIPINAEMVDQATGRTWQQGLASGMRGLAVAAVVLLLVSLFLIENDGGAVVAAIMLSGSLGVLTAQFLCRLASGRQSRGAPVAVSVLGLALVAGGCAFLLFSLIAFVLG